LLAGAVWLRVDLAERAGAGRAFGGGLSAACVSRPAARACRARDRPPSLTRCACAISASGKVCATKLLSAEPRRRRARVVDQYVQMPVFVAYPGGRRLDAAIVGSRMGTRRRHTPEQIIRKLREGEPLVGLGQGLAEVCKQLEISELTWHCATICVDHGPAQTPAKGRQTMGFFGTYHFDGHRWIPRPGDTLSTGPEPWLLVDIHDSDIATILYRPTGSGSGVAYLGFTPRTYFEDPDASAPTDVTREAEGLAEWWARYRGIADEAERRAKAAELVTYIATDSDSAELDPDEDDDAEDLDDADIFVEAKTARFLAALDLPPVNELPH
jgi:hypothetical protein